MGDDRTLARELLTRLVRATPDGRPDRRPLHQYRLDRDDFAASRDLLRRIAPIALDTLEGGALFVAFAAEWFRRDRVGGHWDWKRPLREIGLTYGQDDPTATIGYGRIVAAVENGLRWWGRPEPTHGDRIIAIVREAGFPAAALRDNRRVTDWLRHAVRGIERGFDPREAVGLESYRMNATRIVHATFDAAVELCVAIVSLRRLIHERDPAARDPIAVLDAAQPDWRTTLPFELEPQDVATVVEMVIRAPADTASALFAIRRLRRSGATWRATAGVGVAGPVDVRRLPPRGADELGSAMRLRIVPRGELIGAVPVLAALERSGEDGEEAVWWARPVAVDFEAPLALDAEIRLGAMVGETLIDEFPAYAGQSLCGEVVALEPAGLCEAAECEELIALGCSPVRTKFPWLALAVTPEALPRMTFEGESWNIGSADGRRVIAFTGRAVLDAGDGTRLVWRTGVDKASAPRLAFSGPTVRRLRETVYLDLPSVWIESDDMVRSCRAADLRWRPTGRGRWRTMSDGAPWGRISIGVFAGDDLRAYANVVVVPPEFELKPSRLRKGLAILGLEAARLTARAGAILPVERDGPRGFIDLSHLEPGRMIELRAAWEAEAVLTLCNPISDQALITPDGHLAPRRHELSIGRLHGYRLVTSEKGRIVFELVSPGAPRRMFTRTVFGEAPLMAWVEDLRNLLGTSDDLDAAVRLTWNGAEEWSCQIKWFDLDPRTYGDEDANLLGASRLAMLGVDEVVGMSVCEPGRNPVVVSASGGDLASWLRPALGDAPWLVYGAARNGRILRPRILDDGCRDGARSSPYLDAVGHRNPAERQRRLEALAALPSAWRADDRRRWLDLCAFAMRARLPYAAFDPLRVLDRRPSAAVWLLAFAEGDDEQAAVLALQRELPFLWACTAMSDWLEAFEARAADLAAKISENGGDADLAETVLLSALGRLADRAPDLAPRLRAVLLTLLAGRPDGPTAACADLGDRLRRGIQGAALLDLAARTNLFMQRHADGPPPPSNLGLATSTPAAQDLVKRFEGFDDVVAAPVAAATAAFGQRGSDPLLLSACRAAWLFDPEHFDAAAAGLVAAWSVSGPPRVSETTR